MYEPDGLSSPAIFAFFINASEIFALYSDIFFILFSKSNFSKFSSICLSNNCISAEYASVCPAKASLISASSFAIFSFKPSSFLL